VDYREESIATAQRPRDYAGLLWIFAASILGFGLLCGTSAIALSDPTLNQPISIEARDVVDFAFSNPNAVAALTLQAFSDLIPTATITPTASSIPPTATPTPSRTLAPVFVNTQMLQPTETSKPNNPPIRPTNTPRPRPTNTAVKIQTYTASPFVFEPTETFEPTSTPVPPPTNTPAPPPTNTPG